MRASSTGPKSREEIDAEIAKEALDAEFAKNELAEKDRKVLDVEKIKILVSRINAEFKEENVKQAMDAVAEFQQYIRLALDSVKKAMDVQQAQERLRAALGDAFENFKMENPKFFVQLLEAATELSDVTGKYHYFIEEGTATDSNAVAYAKLYKSMLVILNGLRLLTVVAQDEKRDYEKEDPQFKSKIKSTVSAIKISLGFDSFEIYMRDVFKIVSDSKEENYLSKLEKCDFIDDFFEKDAATWSYLLELKASEPDNFIPVTYKLIYIPAQSELMPEAFKAVRLALKEELPPRDEKEANKFFDNLDEDFIAELKPFWDKVRNQNSHIDKDLLEKRIETMQEKLLFAYHSKVISLLFKNIKYDRGPFAPLKWEKELQAKNRARKLKIELKDEAKAELNKGPLFVSNDQIKKWLHNRLENIRFLCQKEGNPNPENKDKLDKLINILYQGGGISKVVKELTSIWNAILSANNGSIQHAIDSLDDSAKFFDLNMICLLHDICEMTKSSAMPRDLNIERPLLDRPITVTKDDFTHLLSEFKKLQEKDKDKRWEGVAWLVNMHKEFADLGFCTLSQAYASALTEIEIFANQVRDPKEELKGISTQSFKQLLYGIIEAERYSRVLYPHLKLMVEKTIIAYEPKKLKLFESKHNQDIQRLCNVFSISTPDTKQESRIYTAAEQIQALEEVILGTLKTKKWGVIVGKQKEFNWKYDDAAWFKVKKRIDEGGHRLFKDLCKILDVAYKTATDLDQSDRRKYLKALVTQTAHEIRNAERNLSVGMAEIDQAFGSAPQHKTFAKKATVPSKEGTDKSITKKVR